MRSDCLLLFFTEGFTLSKACKVEVLTAVRKRIPIILVRETDSSHGADSFASLLRRTRLTSAPVVSVHQSVKGGESKADRIRRDDIEATDALDALGRRLRPSRMRARPRQGRAGGLARQSNATTVRAARRARWSRTRRSRAARRPPLRGYRPRARPSTATTTAPVVVPMVAEEEAAAATTTRALASYAWCRGSITTST